jgi:hypothetical protein
LKAEANKLKKLKEDKPRGLAGQPVHKLIKHASMFHNLTEAFVSMWRELPIKYGYSPGNPGDIANLKKALPGLVWSSDKSSWEFNVFFWHYLCFIIVVQKLCIKPPDMTDEEFNRYLYVEIPEAISEMYIDCKYRTSNGTVFHMKVQGIMKSGWFLTILANSVMQLIHNVMVLILLGQSDDEILSKGIVAGGDDVEQEPAADKEAYLACTAELGVKMEIEEHEGLEFSEYFSAKLRLDESKRWQFFPVRFTKHIEHLKTIKKENMASALSNYMGDHRHDADRYNLFLRIFHLFRKEHPGLFPLGFLKSRQVLLATQYGYESAVACSD